MINSESGHVELILVDEILGWDDEQGGNSDDVRVDEWTLDLSDWLTVHRLDYQYHILYYLQS